MAAPGEYNNSNSLQSQEEDFISFILADSALPTGGFIASSGLETAAQIGFISTPEKLRSFIFNSICSFSNTSVPFMTCAFRLGNGDIIPELASRSGIQGIRLLDHRCDSFTSNHVTKRASKAQGIAILTLLCKCFGNIPSEIDQYRKDVRVSMII